MDARFKIADLLPLWSCTFCEPTPGWPGLWTIIWRNSRFHAKIGGNFKGGKKKPTPEQIDSALAFELKKRLRPENKLNCDAKEIAHAHFLQKELREIRTLEYEIGEYAMKNAENLSRALLENTENPVVNVLFQRIRDYICLREAINNFSESIGYDRGKVRTE